MKDVEQASITDLPSVASTIDDKEAEPYHAEMQPTAKEDKLTERKEGIMSKRCLLVTLALAVAIAIGVGVGVSLRGRGRGSSDDSSSASVIPPFPPSTGDGGTTSFISVGCFEHESSPDTHTLVTSGRARECSSKCFTRYFGVTSSTCSCFVSAPDNRIAIGSCPDNESTTTTTTALPMEVYFDQATNMACSQERTETVRNFLVEEDDAPFGFDIVANTFRPSPFELFKDECGTNIYEVQTEVSEGSQSLQTTVSDVASFAESRRAERTSSLETSASASYKGFLFSASAQVSASLDTEQTNLFQSSGASETNARVFTSTGVKRLAEVKIVDFDNTYKFVTLARPFGNLLRAYLISDFSKEKANEIIDKYGQFVLTRGIFGGYMELRMTMSNSDVENSFSSEADLVQCYEASVSVEASGFGFSGKGSVGASGCTEDNVAVMRANRDRYGSEVAEQTVVGGRKTCSTCSEFSVEAEDSTLLTTKDKYPPNDDGVTFRLLSDFLHPDKISPLEVKRLQITESQFADIQSNLELYILEYLDDVGSSFGDCECSGVLYLIEDDSTGVRTCECYDPLSPNDRTNFCSSPEQLGMTLKSWYFGHVNGGSGLWSQCSTLCAEDPKCNSWMGRNSGNACYLSEDAELKVKPEGCCSDHHPHTFNRGNCSQ